MGAEMKYRKLLTGILAAALVAVTAGCADSAPPQETVPGAQTRQEETDQASVPESAQEGTRSEAESETAAAQADKTRVRVGSLKGPTSMGLVSLMEKAEAGEASNAYTFTMETSADTLLPMLIKGDLDIALVPANVASLLYQKTDGGIYALDINTLGVLYMVSGDESIREPADLKGRSVYLTGKGTTPDYVLQYILKENGLTDEVKLEYKSEASEVAALLAQEPDGVGLLPEPFVTAACAKNDALKAVLDMNEEWDKLQGQEGGSRLVTGVTVVRKDFLTENGLAVLSFMQEQKESVEAVNADPAAAAGLVAAAGIVEKAAVAQKAIPKCNITYLEGEEMKDALSGYLGVLFSQNPESVGGSLPDDAFYLMTGVKLETETADEAQD